MVKLRAISDKLSKYYILGLSYELYSIENAILEVENKEDIEYFKQLGFREINKGGKK